MVRRRGTEDLALLLGGLPPAVGAAGGPAATGRGHARLLLPGAGPPVGGSRAGPAHERIGRGDRFLPEQALARHGRLEAAGWAERRSSPTDGRGEIAALTTQGLAALEEAAPGHVTAVRESLFDVLNPGQARELGRISQQVIEGLRADIGTPTARHQRTPQGLQGS